MCSLWPMPRARPSSWFGRYRSGTPLGDVVLAGASGFMLWGLSEYAFHRWLYHQHHGILGDGSSPPPRGPWDVDRDALAHDRPNDGRTLVSLRRRAAPSAFFSLPGRMASGERLVLPRPPQPSPLGHQDIVVTQVEGPPPDPSPMSRVQLRSDDAAVGQRVRHSLSGPGLFATGYGRQSVATNMKPSEPWSGSVSLCSVRSIQTCPNHAHRLAAYRYDLVRAFECGCEGRRHGRLSGRIK